METKLRKNWIVFVHIGYCYDDRCIMLLLGYSTGLFGKNLKEKKFKRLSLNIEIALTICNFLFHKIDSCH